MDPTMTLADANRGWISPSPSVTMQPFGHGHARLRPDPSEICIVRPPALAGRRRHRDDEPIVTGFPRRLLGVALALIAIVSIAACSSAASASPGASPSPSLAAA